MLKTNGQIANFLYRIAALLEWTDEPFKARAYAAAADVISDMRDAVAERIRNGTLLQVPSVGTSIASIVAEWVDTGECADLEELEKRFPYSLSQLIEIPGIGVKTAKRLYQELGISTPEELERACLAHQIMRISGFGVRTEQKLLLAVRNKQLSGERFQLGILMPLAIELIEQIESWKMADEVLLTGSVRRMCELARNVNLLVLSQEKDWNCLMKQIQQIQRVVQINAQEKSRILLKLQWRKFLVPVVFQLALPEQKGIAAVQFTGSNLHVEGIIKRLNGIAIRPEALRSEPLLYQDLQLSYIPPELREGTRELEAASKQMLPKLLERSDIQSDLHLHSEWSDGSHSIEQIADFLRQNGYRFMAVTDHSKYLSIARGLTEDRLKRQMEEVQRLNARWNDFVILCGTEMDILPDGSLDFPDELLRELDFVVASIHSAFHQTEEKLTERILNACRNPYVHLIGHPTGRLLSRRSPYPLDLGLIFQTAARTGTALEINASPNRLDLNAELAKLAKEQGVKFSLNTDAHHLSEFSYLLYGIGTARRAWLTAEDILNAWDLKSLKRFLNQKRMNVLNVIK